MERYTRRRIVNYFNLTVSVLTMGFGLFWLAWILVTLVQYGLGGINVSLFTQMTPPPGSAGGLANAVTGSLIMTVLAVAVGAPVGVLAGTYLAEYGRHSRVAGFVLFINDILLSAPSIIIGLFIYALMVVPLGHFSGWAGAMSLAVIVLPVVVRTTDNMLRLVPDNLREAAAALGAPRWLVILRISYRASRAGILTGVILAVARISGETAPLLFTALNNQFWSTNLGRAMSNLPVVIFQYAMSPYKDWQHLAWAGALLITFSVLALSVVARIFLRGPEHES